MPERQLFVPDAPAQGAAQAGTVRPGVPELEPNQLPDRAAQQRSQPDAKEPPELVRGAVLQVDDDRVPGVIIRLEGRSPADGHALLVPEHGPVRINDFVAKLLRPDLPIEVLALEGKFRVIPPCSIPDLLFHQPVDVITPIALLVAVILPGIPFPVADVPAVPHDRIEFFPDRLQGIRLTMEIHFANDKSCLFICLSGVHQGADEPFVGLHVIIGDQDEIRRLLFECVFEPQIESARILQIDVRSQDLHGRESACNVFPGAVGGPVIDDDEPKIVIVIRRV